MKNYIPTALCCLGIIACMAFPLGAQDLAKGYYISNKGDSLSGQLYIGSLKDNVLKFRTPSARNWTKLTPADIREIHGENDLFITTQQVVFQSDTATIFLQRIVHGGYDLYEGAREKQVSLFFFNSQEKPNRIRANPRGLETQFKVFFGACAEETKAKLQYDKISLVRYFKAMNACAYPGQMPKAQAEKTLRPRFGLGIMAGYYFQPTPTFSRARTITTALSAKGYSNSNHPIVGLSANLNVSRTLGIVAGINYVDKSLSSDTMESKLYRNFDAIHPHTGEPISTGVNYYYRHVFEVNMKHLEIPIGLRLRPMPYSKNGPTIAAGLTLSIPLVTEFDKAWGTPYKMESPWYLSPKPPLEAGIASSPKLELDSPIVGIYLGAGWRKQLPHKNEIEIMFQYIYTKETATVSYGGFLSHIISTQDMVWHRFQLSAQYYFSFGK